MAKEKELPTCMEFLVFTIRHLRRKRNEIHGVRLSLVYKAARDLFSDEEIRSTLNAALKKKTLLVMARHSVFEEGRPTSQLKPLDRILKKYPLRENLWRFTAEGKFIAASGDTRTMFRTILVYVVEDGLPENVQQILGRTVKNPPPRLGERILEAMMAERQKKK